VEELQRAKKMLIGAPLESNKMGIEPMTTEIVHQIA